MDKGTADQKETGFLGLCRESLALFLDHMDRTPEGRTGHSRELIQDQKDKAQKDLGKLALRVWVAVVFRFLLAVLAVVQLEGDSPEMVVLVQIDLRTTDTHPSMILILHFQVFS